VKELVYKRYLLGLLAVILAFNYADRLALGILAQDIKDDLDLTDTQLGFLSGFAFALFYSVMGLPIARWADRGDRVTIISLTAALWSTMVALCGLATSFVQLLFIRIGVAVGEAGCIPPAHSLIADRFNRAERPRAVATYLLGGPLSFVFGYFLAGWLNQLYGWRATFIILGLPGLALAVAARLTLREPRRERPVAPSESQQPSLREVGATLWVNTTFRHLVIAFSILQFFGYGIGQWQPAFIIRSHGLSTGELGSWFAIILGGTGLIGTYAGGRLAARYAPQDETRQLKWMAVAIAAFAAAAAGIYLAPDRHWAFGWLALASLGGAAINGPLFATVQTIVPQHLRAVSIALIYLVANLIGMGLGPLIVGALSDGFRSWLGEDSLRYALLALCPGYLWVSWHLLHASRTVGRDLESLRRADVSVA
jgi:MFS transporter, Spinster family, sphingosine-1-phosphate transporter